MTVFILRESCKFDRSRNYIDIFHGEEPDTAKSGDQTIHLPADEAAALVWKMNPDRLPLYARLKFGYATPEERAEHEEFIKEMAEMAALQNSDCVPASVAGLVGAHA